VIAENMAENIENHGGCSLIVDYGDVKCDRHTLRVRMIAYVSQIETS
jgi:hypothetical protein